MRARCLIIILYTTVAYGVAGGSKDSKKEVNPQEITEVSITTIAGSTFRLGDVFNEGAADELPVSFVTVSDFSMSTHEITVGQFKRFVEKTGYITDAESEGWAFIWDGASWAKEYGATFRSPGFAQTDEHPVVCVSWRDAVAYCEWLSGLTGRSVRLPTEAEWEFSARERGMRPRYGWGNGEPNGNVADETAGAKWPSLKIWSGYSDGYVTTAPVGKFRPNSIGLYDMSGNVLEWCADSYGSYTKEQKNDPIVRKEDSFKVLRGGSWFNAEPGVRTTARTRLNQSYRGTRVGFRVVVR
jgi:sulfatase modifying factor 1